MELEETKVTKLHASLPHLLFLLCIAVVGNLLGEFECELSSLLSSSWLQEPSLSFPSLSLSVTLSHESPCDSPRCDSVCERVCEGKYSEKVSLPQCVLWVV